MWIHRVRRNSQRCERIYGVEPIDALIHQHNIWMQRRDRFDARTDCAADVRLLLGLRRIVAIVAVGDQPVLQSESVKRFCNAGSQRNDAANVLWDLNFAAKFIGDFARWPGREGRSRIRCGLRRVLGVRARRESREEKERSRETARYAKILGERASLHEYPLIADSYCVHANKSEWCDSKVAARFRPTAKRIKSVWFAYVECQRATRAETSPETAPLAIFPVRLALLD